MNPERGRKPEQDAAVEDAITAISEHEPRKGTETPSEIRPCTSWENFRTRTPKGDGNVNSSMFTPSSFAISEHEPRKGTETGTEHHIELFRYSFQNTNPERGRKL